MAVEDAGSTGDEFVESVFPLTDDTIFEPATMQQWLDGLREMWHLPTLSGSEGETVPGLPGIIRARATEIAGKCMNPYGPCGMKIDVEGGATGQATETSLVFRCPRALFAASENPPEEYETCEGRHEDEVEQISNVIEVAVQDFEDAKQALQAAQRSYVEKGRNL